MPNIQEELIKELEQFAARLHTQYGDDDVPHMYGVRWEVIDEEYKNWLKDAFHTIEEQGYERGKKDGIEEEWCIPDTKGIQIAFSDGYKIAINKVIKELERVKDPYPYMLSLKVEAKGGVSKNLIAEEKVAGDPSKWRFTLDEVEEIKKEAEDQGYEKGLLEGWQKGYEKGKEEAIEQTRKDVVEKLKNRKEELETYAEWLDTRLMNGDWPELTEDFKNEEEIRMKIGKNLCQAEQIQEIIEFYLI